MKRLTSLKTLSILHSILQNPSFTQTGIARETQVSIGRVNGITKWLLQKGMIKKETGSYLLIAPNKIITHIAAQHTLTQNRVFEINRPKPETKELLIKTTAVCLHTALEEHEKKEISNDLYAYVNQKIIDVLNKEERGTTRIILYDPPTPLPTREVTSQIQTIIDLHITEEHQLTRELSLKLWNTLQ
ncbi:MAG: MarR family transcriptional regulator [Nanobdellota archaeon]